MNFVINVMMKKWECLDALLQKDVVIFIQMMNLTAMNVNLDISIIQKVNAILDKDKEKK